MVEILDSAQHLKQRNESTLENIEQTRDVIAKIETRNFGIEKIFCGSRTRSTVTLNFREHLEFQKIHMSSI